MTAKTQHLLLKLWHAWLAGGYTVAYLTADEDTYAMHLFAGYAVVAAIVARLLAGAVAPANGPLRLPRPSLAEARQWLSRGKGRNPLFAVFAAALLVVVGVSGVTGVLADGAAWMEDPHEAVSEFSLMLILGHVAFVAFMYGGKRLLKRVAATAVVALVAVPGLAMAGPRDDILSHYAAQVPAFAGFSAQRGETLFRTQWNGGDARTPACTACHTADPRAAGRNAKTGRPIEPVAVSANAKRFTDLAEVEKQFGRDCKNVLGRECTAQEKGDYVTFMAGQ